MKAIYVRRGEVLKIECLQDGTTGEDYLLVRNDKGITVRANEIIAMGASTIFTTDETKRKFSKETLHYQLYLTIKEFVKVKDGKWGMDKGTLGDFGEVNYALAKNLATYINGDLGNGQFHGFSSSTISKLCREIGFRFARTGAGYAIVLEDADLLAIEKRFEVSPQAG